MIRWRELFDHIRIEWRDRGANCARGRVNCQCPWCGKNDPSFHLTISEETGGYYCLRAPLTHRGKSLPYLLICLGIPGYEIDGLMSAYTDNTIEVKAKPRQEAVDWRKFDPACDVDMCLDYLGSRGFADPAEVCREYDLRFTRYGRYSWRLLFPLMTNGNISGLTGRALRSSQDPRYLTNDPFGCSIFLPMAFPNACLVLIEGPMDALAAAVAAKPHAFAITNPRITPAAILGLSLPVERRLYLATLAKGASSVIYVPDDDQAHSDTYRLIDELQGTPGFGFIKLARSPAGTKDLAKFYQDDQEGLQKWLKKNASSQNGTARHSNPMRQTL